MSRAPPFVLGAIGGRTRGRGNCVSRRHATSSRARIREAGASSILLLLIVIVCAAAWGARLTSAQTTTIPAPIVPPTSAALTSDGQRLIISFPSSGTPTAPLAAPIMNLVREIDNLYTRGASESERRALVARHPSMVSSRPPQGVGSANPLAASLLDWDCATLKRHVAVADAGHRDYGRPSFDYLAKRRPSATLGALNYCGGQWVYNPFGSPPREMHLVIFLGGDASLPPLTARVGFFADGSLNADDTAADHLSAAMGTGATPLAPRVVAAKVTDGMGADPSGLARTPQEGGFGLSEPNSGAYVHTGIGNSALTGPAAFYSVAQYYGLTSGAELDARTADYALPAWAIVLIAMGATLLLTVLLGLLTHAVLWCAANRLGGDAIGWVSDASDGEDATKVKRQRPAAEQWATAANYYIQPEDQQQSAIGMGAAAWNAAAADKAEADVSFPHTRIHRWGPPSRRADLVRPRPPTLTATDPRWLGPPPHSTHGYPPPSGDTSKMTVRFDGERAPSAGVVFAAERVLPAARLPAHFDPSPITTTRSLSHKVNMQQIAMDPNFSRARSNPFGSGSDEDEVWDREDDGHLPLHQRRLPSLGPRKTNYTVVDGIVFQDATTPRVVMLSNIGPSRPLGNNAAEYLTPGNFYGVHSSNISRGGGIPPAAAAAETAGSILVDRTMIRYQGTVATRHETEGRYALDTTTNSFVGDR